MMNAERIALAYAETGQLPPKLSQPQLLHVWVELGKLAWTRRGLMLANKWLKIVEFSPDDHVRGVFGTLATRMALFACQYAADIQQPFYLPPCDLPATRYSLALTFSSGERISRKERNFLLPLSSAGHVVFISGPRKLSEAWNLTDNLDFLNGKTDVYKSVEIPDELLIERHVHELAYAFTRKMVAEAQQAGRPPLIGEFVMKPPDYLDFFRELDLSQVRLIIKSSGIWCTIVYDDGVITTGWWSPDDDNLVINFGIKMAWAMRVFLACLWRDAVVTKKQSFRVKRINSRSLSSPRPKVPGRTIVLPRTIRTMEWGPEEFAAYQGQCAGSKRAHRVREHYRKLQPFHEASETAVTNAEAYGYPAPPDGFTFVQSYRTGDSDDDIIPRIVSRGLKVAAVTLSKIR